MILVREKDDCQYLSEMSYNIDILIQSDSNIYKIWSFCKSSKCELAKECLSSL